jgi:hypothetical protein
MSIVFSPKTWIALFAVLAAATIAAALFVVQTPDFRQDPGWLSFGVSFDLTIGIPLAYYLIISRKLKVTPVTVSGVFLLCTGIASLILPASGQYYLHLVEKALMVTEAGLLVYGVIQVRKIIGAYRAAAQRRADFLLNLQEAVAQLSGVRTIVALVSHEISTFRYGLFFWLGGKEVLTEQRFFTTHKESGYVAIGVVLLFVLVIETVGLHFLLLRWSAVAAVTATILSVYTILFFVADLAALLKRPIVFEDSQLLFRIGIRWNALISLENIKGATQIKNFDKAKEKRTLLCALTGSPNLVIELNQPVTVTGFYGIRKQTQRIAFNVDDPAGFIREVTGKP